MTKKATVKSPNFENDIPLPQIRRILANAIGHGFTPDQIEFVSHRPTFAPPEIVATINTDGQTIKMTELHIRKAMAQACNVTEKDVYLRVSQRQNVKGGLITEAVLLGAKIHAPYSEKTPPQP
ncbi:MAG: hypothetical protein WC464_01555 [Bdellovibrionales bacterium]